MITWDLTLKHTFTWEFYDTLVGRTGKTLTKAGFCMRESMQAMEKLMRTNVVSNTEESTEPPVFLPCDFYAAAVLIDETLIKESKTKFVSIEL